MVSRETRIKRWSSGDCIVFSSYALGMFAEDDAAVKAAEESARLAREAIEAAA
jgi:hypothetical protein